MPGGGDLSRSLGEGLLDGAQGEGGVRRTLQAAAQLAPDGQGPGTGMTTRAKLRWPEASRGVDSYRA